MKKKATPLFGPDTVSPEFYVEEPRTSFKGKNTSKIAELQDGTKVRYDYCLREEEIFHKPNAEFLGRGKIFSIDGVIQFDDSEDTFCFWRDKFKVVGGIRERDPAFKKKVDEDYRSILASRAKEHAEEQIVNAILGKK